MKFFSIKFSPVLLGALFLFGCYAQQPVQPISNFTPTVFDSDRYSSSVDNFLIILDASSSMDDIYEKHQKFTIATELINRMNQTLPELGQNGGLRSFGHSPAVSDKATVLFYGMAPYSTNALKEKLDMISSPGGTSPMHKALTEAGQDLNGASGKTAVVIISDGQKENSMASPVTLAAAQALKDQLGSELCFYTIFIGDDANGGPLMEEISQIGTCGFATNADKLLTGDGMAQFVKDVFLVEKPASKEIVMEKVAPPVTNAPEAWVIDEAYFDFNKTVIKPKAFDFLDKIAEFIIANPEIFVTVQGHTDSVGTKTYNDALSLKRANAVKTYLTNKGIDGNRLSCEGFGFSKPAASNKTTDGRSLNRRVEIHPVN